MDTDLTLRWFGPPSVRSLRVVDVTRVATPLGAPCLYCAEEIVTEDVGFLLPCFTPEGPKRLPAHRECQIRALVGGVNHVRGVCTCQGGSLPPDPPGVSKRDAARAALVEWERRQNAGLS